MGVKLTPEELDAFLDKGHTLIVATVRKSGEPFLVPVWYVWRDGAFWVGTPARSSKVAHIKRDPRVCCMVEEGEAWLDLKAVIMNCEASVVEDTGKIAEIEAAIDRKYEGFRMDRSKLPEATRNHYATGRVILRFTPKPGELRSWYNRKIRMG